ncbi:MAG TPA: ABC transporter ATP-binding protein [Anaerolineaceae bacterium]|nr:ABC transporter ATP-binding protein [Anaerolineaceae bacterium]
MSAIRTDGLQKVYGAVRALDGLTLEVAEGTVFGFLGPNGAGKSTTIRLLTGLAHPSAGRAWIAGQEVTANCPNIKIGYLPEDPAFYTWMTPFELLDHVGRLFGLPPADRKARCKQLLELSGLTEVRKRRIGGFSRGMRQRLGLAQALVNRPQVLFLDEPVSALDPAGRKEVLELILGLRGECTVFMSTHILADVERVCDTVGIINHGKLVVEARQSDLLAQYSVPAIELACVPGQEAMLKTWADGLRSQPWLGSTTVEGCQARLVVNDMSAARGALLSSVLQVGLTLNRYEIVTPSLEDIFLRLVNKEGEA